MKEILSEWRKFVNEAEQVSEVFQSGLHTMDASKALEHYQETLKDYEGVASKISRMLPDEKVEEGTKAVDETQYAIEEVMELVKFVLENQSMSRQQKDKVREEALDIYHERKGEAVLRVLKIVLDTPEELEDLVYELHEKYQVAEKYLLGILDPEYKGTDPTDADFEDAGKQMGLGLQEEDLDERCQKGYKTHPTRKTKKMYGKTYRNCVKAEE